MKIYTLVNFLDIHNEGSLIAAAKFNPRKVIYLMNIKSFYLEYFSNGKDDENL